MKSTSYVSASVTLVSQRVSTTGKVRENLEESGNFKSLEKSGKCQGKVREIGECFWKIGNNCEIYAQKLQITFIVI